MVKSAKGCRLYLVGKDKDDPDGIWVTEAWDSKEDHGNSLKMKGVRVVIGQAMPLLDGPHEKGQVLETLGGAGLDN